LNQSYIYIYIYNFFGKNPIEKRREYLLLSGAVFIYWDEKKGRENKG